MKKIAFLFISVLGLVAYSIAGTRIGDIGPSFSDSATVTIAAPGSSNRNCISDIVFSSTASTTGISTFRMLTNQTTTFMVIMSTINPPVVDPFTDAWCADFGSSATIKSDGRSYQIYFKGFIEKVY